MESSRDLLPRGAAGEGQRRDRSLIRWPSPLEHDPEKCVAVF
jgi:hypothetical protein